MILVIGFIIANYAFARLLETAMRKDNHLLVRVVAVLAIVINVLLALGLVVSSSPPIPPAVR